MIIVRIFALSCLALLVRSSLFLKERSHPIISKSLIPNEPVKSSPVKFSPKDVRDLACRLPRAIGRSLKISAKSFLTSSVVLFPVGLVMNVNNMRPIDAWVMKGASTGIEWAKIGAYFAGAETFFATMRNKEDRLNSYLGSGVTSSLLRFNEGPVGMVKGFAVGYGFMYAIDKFVVQEPNLGGSKLAFPSRRANGGSESVTKTSVAPPPSAQKATVISSTGSTGSGVNDGRGNSAANGGRFPVTGFTGLLMPARMK